ncbi:MAG TPA: hypothetical protein DGM69_05585 [Chloroflexi bacterium]|nr:hypothetical protein [Chloroflexota bacterium]
MYRCLYKTPIHLLSTLLSIIEENMSIPIILSLCALVGFGLSNFLWKVAGNNNVFPASFMLVETGVVFCLAVIVHLIQKQTFVLSSKMLGLASLSGLTAGIAIISTISAFRLGGEASVVSPITSLGFVIVVLLAYILLKEPITLSKGLGSILAVVAIVLLSR